VFFRGLAWHLVGWLVGRLDEWQSLQAVPPRCFLIPLLHVARIYLFSHQTSRIIISPARCDSVCAYLCTVQYTYTHTCTHITVYCCGEIHRSRWIRGRCRCILLLNLNKKLLSSMNGKKMGQQNTFATNNLCDRCFNIWVILLPVLCAFDSGCSMAAALVLTIDVLLYV